MADRAAGGGKKFWRNYVKPDYLFFFGLHTKLHTTNHLKYGEGKKEVIILMSSEYYN